MAEHMCFRNEIVAKVDFATENKSYCREKLLFQIVTTK